jgi:uncharacterized protein YbjT (DUF2867 family)
VESRTALLIGATGLIGRACLGRLLAENRYSRVTVVARRSTTKVHPRLVEAILDFDQLAARADVLQGEDVYCCLGTTIKQAGSQTAFRKVDHDHVLTVATLARKNGARRLALVSSVGADATSKNFYLRTKGETERDVAKLGFEQLELLRPSVLVGTREQARGAEALGASLGSALAPLLFGPLRKYRPISADVVAAAMLAALRRDEKGVHVRLHDELHALAGSS